MPNIVVWRPSYGKMKVHNLGGSTGTLDGKWEAFELDDGLMTREGWFLYDDTEKPLLKDGSAVVREVREGDMDVYLFCYGKDFQKGLQELCDVSGIPVPGILQARTLEWVSISLRYTLIHPKNIY